MYKYTTNELMEMLVKEDGTAYHYIEGDYTVPFNEVLNHHLEYTADMYGITQEEVNHHVSHFDIRLMKDMTYLECKEWTQSHICNMTEQEVNEYLNEVKTTLNI